jgi:hypothetical protein
MHRHTKKDREREILDLVYGFRPPFKVDDCERPDFVARLTPVDEAFGIEVTEFFQTESNARLARIPGYVGGLLGGGGFRHKADRHGLTVDKIQIMSGGTVKFSDVPAIVQRVPQASECAAMVSEIIRKKGEKLEAAFQGLRHINLIICDRTNLLRLLKPSNFYDSYCTEALRQSLFSSPFREVYFATSLSVGEVFIPLKMLVALAQFYFFDAFAQARRLLSKNEASGEFMRCFASYLSTIATDNVYIFGDGRETGAIYGDTGFFLDAALRLQLRIYSDAPILGGKAEALSSLVMSDSTIADQMRSFQRENKFETNIAFKQRSGDHAAD